VGARKGCGLISERGVMGIDELIASGSLVIKSMAVPRSYNLVSCTAGAHR
jgi:hypothetical protein